MHRALPIKYEDTKAPSIEVYENLCPLRKVLEAKYQSESWFILGAIRNFNNAEILLVSIIKDTEKDKILLPAIFHGIKVYYYYDEITPFCISPGKQMGPMKKQLKSK